MCGASRSEERLCRKREKPLRVATCARVRQPFTLLGRTGFSGYGGEEEGMNDDQWQAMYEYFTSLLDKTCVGCLLVGLFQIEHLFGGIVGAVVCGLSGLVLKIWSRK